MSWISPSAWPSTPRLRQRCWIQPPIASVPRNGVQLADVTVMGSEAGERIYAGIGSLIDAAGGDDELFNIDSLGGNILVGGQRC